MELSKQVCSLEPAKKLKELGVKQDSYFSWRESSIDAILITNPDKALYGSFKHYSAFTVAELGEMLPAGHILSSKIYFTNCPNTGEVEWCIKYKKNEEIEICENIKADARAKMLIYLLENNLIKL